MATARADRSNSLMDISADGLLLACANRDAGTVTVVDLVSHRKLREVSVGRHPEGLTFVGRTRTLAVAVYDEDRVVFLDADTGATAGVAEVFDEPYGVVSNAAGSKVYVTLEYPGHVAELDAASGRQLRTFEAGRFPRGVALTAGERVLLVTEYYTGVVRAIDVATGEEVDRWSAASTDNLARQITLHPTRPKAYVPHIRSRVTAAHGEGSIFPYVAVIDTERGKGGDESGRKRIPMDAFRSNFVVANPWEAALSPDGKRLYVVFSGTDDLFVCDVIDDDYRELAYRAHLRLGRNPRAVRVSRSGDRFYIYNALDFNVVAYDAGSLEAVATIAVCENPLSEEVLAGKVLFYSALQPMVGRRWISCSSCHPDGDPDGRTWNNPEGLRATPSLAGLAWTHPLHWSADRDETQDFEHTVRGPLMQGRGLIDGAVNPSLEAPNGGVSDRLDALAAYTNSHAFTLSPHGRSGLSDAAIRGRKVFLSKETRCAECHPPPLYTDSRPGPEIVRHDVG
ncbi:MAG: beta-propeller fold lactonase family protein, partial [Actinobacteria bacterium]|nr:beta-propeller fold lactonase family protein [Actinomycetota bacterium]